MWDFSTLLHYAAAMLACIVLFAFFNEKVTKLPTEIALMLCAFVVGALVLLLEVTGVIVPLDPKSNLLTFNLDDYLVDGVLCFMLFAGACRLRMQDIRPHARCITVLSLVATLLTTGIYGGLFSLLSLVLGLPIDFVYCLLLGAIVAPTDPIAAMSILRGMGLPEDLGLVIEGESLFNDGVAVALFVTLCGIIASGDFTLAGFFGVLLRELLGAVAAGFVVSLLTFQIFKRTHIPWLQVCVSLLAVAGAYVLCETLNFSGAISSVVCGIFYATQMARGKTPAQTDAKYPVFYHFWEVIDHLLNGILYVLLGFGLLRLPAVSQIALLCLGAILINTLARAGGVALSTLLCGRLPLAWPKLRFTGLFTWAGLKGGLCLALAASTSGLLQDTPEVLQVFTVATYAIVFFTTIVQGLTVGKGYQLLQPKTPPSGCPASFSKTS